MCNVHAATAAPDHSLPPSPTGLELVLVDIDTDDPGRSSLPTAHGRGQTDGAQSPDGHCAARLDVSRVQRGAVPGGDATAEEADHIQRRLRVHLCSGGGRVKR